MPAGNGLRLLVVDLDDTLWPCTPVIRQAEETHWAWLAPRAPRLAAAHDLATLRAHRIAFAKAHPEVAHDITALRTAALADALAEQGEKPSLAEEAVAVFVAAPCVGDCNEDGIVKVNELILGVNISLERRDLVDCPVSPAAAGDLSPDPVPDPGSAVHRDWRHRS